MGFSSKYHSRVQKNPIVRHFRFSSWHPLGNPSIFFPIGIIIIVEHISQNWAPQYLDRLVVLTILKNMKVSWDDDIPNMMGKIKVMFQTTNQ